MARTLTNWSDVKDVFSRYPSTQSWSGQWNAMGKMIAEVLSVNDEGLPIEAGATTERISALLTVQRNEKRPDEFWTKEQWFFLKLVTHCSSKTNRHADQPAAWCWSQCCTAFLRQWSWLHPPCAGRLFRWSYCQSTSTCARCPGRRATATDPAPPSVCFCWAGYQPQIILQWTNTCVVLILIIHEIAVNPATIPEFCAIARMQPTTLSWHAIQYIPWLGRLGRSSLRNNNTRDEFITSNQQLDCSSCNPVTHSEVITRRGKNPS